MANETKIGQLVIDLQIKTNALEKGLETAKKKLQEIEKQNEQLKSSNNQLDASFIAMSASVVAALTKVSSVIKEATEEYKAYTQAMSSLENVSEYTGESMSDFSKIMDKFSTYMTKSDIATTIKNFSLMGMTAKQTEQMMEALTNSAIRNRNANYTVSEAVRVASEGYRQGLSTLSDSAGVTENLSVMLDNYAKSIGKTASQLTDAERNQAYLNRTMYAAEPFANAMSDYMETLAGKQGEYSQALRETQVTYIEAIEPMLTKFEEFKTKMVSGLEDIISSNEGATAGITTFIITLGTLTIAITAAKKAYDLYKTSAIAATISTQGFTAALAANPIGALAIAISLVVSAFAAYTTATKKQEEAQAILNERTQQYNNILSGKFRYTEQEIANAEKRKSEIEEEIDLLEKITRKRQEATQVQNLFGHNSEEAKKLGNELNDLIKKYEESSKKSIGNNNQVKESLNELYKQLKVYNEQLDKAKAIQNISSAFDTANIKNTQKEAAQLKINVQTMQEYLDIVKKGEKSTTEYQNAVNALSKAYPEAASSGGMLINVLEGLISAEQLQADEAWNASQASIQGHINNIKQALEDESVQKQVAANMGIAYDENFKPKLETVLALLQMIEGYTPEQVPNITPKTYNTKTSSSYTNKRLDNYKKEIEYKKSLDQLSLQQEINMYQTALKKYAKTIDERRELTTKIYELQKEMQQEALDKYVSDIEYKKSLDKLSIQEEIRMYEYAYNSLAKTTEQKQELEVTLYELRKELAQKEKKLLDEQTSDYERYINEQKNLKGAEYDVKEREEDLDKIIKTHQNYLDQILKDERYSLEERKDIYKEELQIIKDYEQQKRDLRVDAIDSTINQLTNAIKKQLKEMQDADKEAINKNIELVKKWKDARIDAINEEYSARIKVIQDELDALDKAEQQKSRDEEDSEYDRKRNRLQDLIAFEHDATTKANYQKELDKLIAEYQKTLDKRALEDRKEALNAQKDLLEEEQDNKVQTIEDEAERQNEIYNKQLEDLDEYYSRQIDMAQETAEKMLLNVQQNQDQILSLLNKYGDKYEITGQSLGEKLAQGINNTLANKIEVIIQTIQDRIDSSIENQISKWASASYKYEAGMNKPQTNTVNVTQNNYIEQNPEMPSETYRKLRNIDEELAASLAGM